MNWDEEFLFTLQQEERLLEQYVEEFLIVLNLVSWSDSMINITFRMGLKEDNLFCRITPDNCSRPVADFLNYVLKLMNSKFFVDVEDPYPPPIRKPADAPAHHKPAPSTCSTNELDSSVPLDFPQRILSSTIILSPVALFADSASPPPFVVNASPSPSTPTQAWH